MRASAYLVPDARLSLSRSPAADLAAVAKLAAIDAKLEAPDYVVVAVEPGRGEAIRAAIENAARALR